jgi:hypothetical protein
MPLGIMALLVENHQFVTKKQLQSILQLKNPLVA